MPSLLRRKALTPAEEAARQLSIAQEIQRQHDAEIQRQRDLTAENARQRAQLWAERDQEREAKRLEAFAAPERARREREERQREQQAKVDAAKMQEYRDAKDRVEQLDAEIRGLANRSDLTGQEAGALVGLRELRRQADAHLIQAERAIGRHRNGGI